MTCDRSGALRKQKNEGTSGQLRQMFVGFSLGFKFAEVFIFNPAFRIVDLVVPTGFLPSQAVLTALVAPPGDCPVPVSARIAPLFGLCIRANSTYADYF